MMLDLDDYAAKLHNAVQDDASAEDRLAAVSKLALHLAYELRNLEERLAKIEKTSDEAA